jgi:hypothetical protein
LPKIWTARSCTIGIPGHAADQQDLIDVGRRAVRIGEALVAGRVEPIDEVAARALELAALELAHQVHRAVGAGRDVTLASASALATS